MADSAQERLIAYLQKAIPDLLEPVTVTGINGTHFHRMAMVTAGSRKLVVKQSPPNMSQTFYTVVREFEMLKRFGKVAYFAPKPILLCDDPDIFGSSFLVMERIEGQSASLPTRENYSALIDVMADLHDIDLEKNGLNDIGSPNGYGPRLLAVWKERMNLFRTDDMPDFSPVEARLERLMPPESAEFSAVHNRLTMENMVWRLNNKERLRGVLDWRMVTTGPAFMDISATLGHWIEDDDVPSLRLLGTVPDGFTRAEAIARYEERRQKKVPHQAFYLATGFYRRASEMQQRYFEYRKSYAHDVVMTRLREAIKGLREMALKIAG